MDWLEYLKYYYHNALTDKDILALTAISVFIYTGLTYLLWRATKKQTDLLHTPYLTLRFSNQDKKIYAKNVGKDIVTKIKIEGQKILTTDVPLCLELKFDVVEILEPGQEKCVPFEAFENGERSTTDFSIYFFSRAAIKRQSPFSLDKRMKRSFFRITFNNIFGERYYYKTYIEDGEYRIKKFGKDNLLKLSVHEAFLFLQSLKVKFEVFVKRRKHEQKNTK